MAETRAVIANLELEKQQAKSELTENKMMLNQTENKRKELADGVEELKFTLQDQENLIRQLDLRVKDLSEAR